MRVLTGVLCVASVVVAAPLWLPIVLAAWTADILDPVFRWLERVLHGRSRAAGVLIALLFAAFLLPLGLAAAALASGAHDLLDSVRKAAEGNESIAKVLFEGEGGKHPAGKQWTELVSRYGAGGWRAFSMVAKASANAAVAMLIYVTGLYTFATDGPRLRAWIEDHAPISPASFSRLSNAFFETGRGLLVAGGGTALVQGLCATIAYFALGIPQAILLGLLTVVTAIVPFVGTSLVWGPLAIELFATGSHGRAAILVTVGLFVSVIDNVVRPWLARYGKLTMPTYAVLVSMLGGIVVFGASGALLGPLIVRLAIEAVAILGAKPLIVAPSAHDLSENDSEIVQ